MTKTNVECIVILNSIATKVVETRKALMGHASGEITTHYCAAELGELLEAAEKITDQKIGQTPTLGLVKNSNFSKGPTQSSAMSEICRK